MSLSLPTLDGFLILPVDSIFISDAWLCVQLGLSVICCCLPTYGLLSPKEKILTPAKILCSKLRSKIITIVTSKESSDPESESQILTALKPKSHHKENPSVGEADGVGLTHAAGDFELGDHHVVAESDLSLNAFSVNGTVEMV